VSIAHSLTLVTSFVLATIKIMGCIGFIILGIIIDCGGVKSDPRGYIGAFNTGMILARSATDSQDSALCS
jgi:amino acid permease